MADPGLELCSDHPPRALCRMPCALACEFEFPPPWCVDKAKAVFVDWVFFFLADCIESLAHDFLVLRNIRSSPSCRYCDFSVVIWVFVWTFFVSLGRMLHKGLSVVTRTVTRYVLYNHLALIINFIGSSTSAFYMAVNVCSGSEPIPFY